MRIKLGKRELIRLFLIGLIFFFISCRSREKAPEDILFDPAGDNLSTGGLPTDIPSLEPEPRVDNRSFFYYENQLSLDEREQFLEDIFQCMAVVDVYEMRDGVKTKVGEIVKDAAKCYVEFAIAKYELPRAEIRLSYSIKGMKERYYRRLSDFLLNCEAMTIKRRERGLEVYEDENHCIDVFRAVMGRVVN